MKRRVFGELPFMKGCYYVARCKVAIRLLTVAKGRLVRTLRLPRGVR